MPGTIRAKQAGAEFDSRIPWRTGLMKVTSLAALTAVTLIAALPDPGWAQEVSEVSDGLIETRIWLDRGVDPVFERGDQARVYYRASVDAYLLLFHVNTDGVLRLLFPGGSDETRRARGGRDYRLLFPDSDYWSVDESPGVGYFFVLASERPFAFERLSQIPVAGGWDSSPQGNRIRSDPYVTVEDFRRVLLPDGDEKAYAIDFTAYHVGQPYSYPRFLCYQCHVDQPFEEWNPYHQTCLDVRVVIYNDPYYYPATRYQGERVVYARPPQPGLPQFTFTRRFLGEAGTPIVQSRVAARNTGSAEAVPGAGGVAAGSSELMRTVDERGIPGQGAVLDRFFPTSPADGAPSASLLPPASRFPAVLPIEPRQDVPRNRPTLRRRNADDRGPGSR